MKWNTTIPTEAVNWLAEGERGISSEQMFETILEFPALSAFNRANRPFGNLPHDPSDFGRCWKLYEQVAEIRDGLDRMREISPAWDNIIEHWDELVRLHKGEDWEAEYKLLRELRYDP